MSKYIKVDDLQSYCDNQKEHSITPNDFQRMNHYDFGWHTGTPTKDGLYIFFHHAWGNENKPLVYSCVERKDGEWMDPLGGNLPFHPYTPIAWQKITPYEG